MINKLSSVLAVIFGLVLLPCVIYSQENTATSCADLKSGIYHSYPKNSTDYFVSVRDGNFQKETDMKTGDTVLWKIAWQKDCTYSLKYISGNTVIKPDVLDVLKKHNLVYEITKVTKDYYIFKAFIDKASGEPFQVDTMWMKQKLTIPNNSLIAPTDPLKLRKAHFSDTSKYAVVYLYRPGKFTNSLGNYPVYFDDNVLCIMENKSGYVFRVLREGRFKMKSKLLKDESVLDLDVKFGNKYYIKSMIHFGIYARLYNFKLELAQVTPEEGIAEFEEVNMK